jgi:hypothetical protein
MIENAKRQNMPESPVCDTENLPGDMPDNWLDTTPEEARWAGEASLGQLVTKLPNGLRCALYLNLDGVPPAEVNTAIDAFMRALMTKVARKAEVRNRMVARKPKRR